MTGMIGELIAAVVSALVGNQWGALTLLSGAVQGLTHDEVFAAARRAAGKGGAVVFVGVQSNTSGI